MPLRYGYKAPGSALDACRTRTASGLPVPAIGPQKNAQRVKAPLKLAQDAVIRQGSTMADVMNRVDFFFEQGKFGWSESYYRAQEELSVTLTAAKKLAKLRAAFNGTDTTLTYVRVSKRDVFNDSEIDSDSIGTHNRGKVQIVNFVGPSDAPWNAFLIRCQHDGLHRRMMYLRGIPDVMVEGDEDKPEITVAKVDKEIKAYKDELENGTWGGRFFDRDNATNPPFVTNQVVNLNGDSTINVPGHTFILGDEVFLKTKKSDGMPSINGKVKTSIAGFVTVFTGAANGTLTFLGSIRKRIHAFKAFTKIIERKTTHRDTGVPFDAPRGRRRRAN